MLNTLRGKGRKDLQDQLPEHFISCWSCQFLQRSELQAGGPLKMDRWGPADPCKLPRRLLHRESLWLFCSWLREIFYWSVPHVVSQVSSLSACWQCFDKREMVVIVWKRSLKENFWKMSPNSLSFWLMGSVQCFLPNDWCLPCVHLAPFSGWQKKRKPVRVSSGH